MRLGDWLVSDWSEGLNSDLSVKSMVSSLYQSASAHHGGSVCEWKTSWDSPE